jgi:hypothetical protein
MDFLDVFNGLFTKNYVWSVDNIQFFGAKFDQHENVVKMIVFDIKVNNKRVNALYDHFEDYNFPECSYAMAKAHTIKEDIKHKIYGNNPILVDEKDLTLCNDEQWKTLVLEEHYY